MTKVKNQRGVGLLEVVVASGIMVIVMLGFASMMDFQTKGAHSIERSVGWDELIGTVTRTLNSSTACTNTLKGQIMQNNGPIILHLGGLNGVGGNLIAANSVYGGMTIAPATPPHPGISIPLVWRNVSITAGQAIGYFSITANIQGSDTNAIVGGNFRATDSILPTGFMVSATVNGGGQIQNCASSLSLGQFQCALSKTTVNTSGLVTVSCPAIKRYALFGGCDGGSGRLDMDYIDPTTMTQYCHQNGGTNNVTASIYCCE